jgi:hypothetical protein
MNDPAEPLDGFIEGTIFTWRQALTQGSTGVIVKPSKEQRLAIIKQAHALVPVFNLLGGFVITSWLRSVQHNKDIGGATKSAHLLGLATDFVPSHCTPAEARQKIRTSGVYIGAGEEFTATWVHLDLLHKHWFKP